MNTVVYSGNAIVELQGKEALSLLSIEDCFARYEIIGFNEMHIVVSDYRKESMNGLRNFLDTGDPTNFHLKFNSLAWIEVYDSPHKNLSVELREPTQGSADNILWIAIGINKGIPAHDYLILESEAMSKDQFALFSLYRYPPQLLRTSQNLFHSYAEIE